MKEQEKERRKTEREKERKREEEKRDTLMVASTIKYKKQNAGDNYTNDK